MRAAGAYAELRAFGRPVITTDDAAVRLRTSAAVASRTLDLLARAGLVVKLRRGLWSLVKGIDPMALIDSLTAPFPSYVSFQSSLFLHGMISQIPQVTYVASLGRTRKVRTTAGNFSIHHLPPDLFGGFTQADDASPRIATPEKALIDTLYLSCTKSRLFAALPELEWPSRFRLREARRWIARIPAAYRRSMVERRFEELRETRRDGEVD